MSFWYNVNTGQVEEDGATSSKDHLMGPYATRGEAERALESAHARTEAWDEEERRRAREEGRDPDDRPW